MQNSVANGEPPTKMPAAKLEDRVAALTHEDGLKVYETTRFIHTYLQGRSPILIQAPLALYDQDLHVGDASITGAVVLDNEMISSLNSREAGWFILDNRGIGTLGAGSRINISTHGAQGRVQEIGAVLAEWGANKETVMLCGYLTPPIYLLRNSKSGDAIMIVRGNKTV